MFEQLDITRMAQALAAHAGARMGQVARNIAQADTPGYKALDLPGFAETYDATADGAMRATRPGHLTSAAPSAVPVTVPSGGEASANGNTVSVEKEMVTAVEVRQQHDMALAIYRNTQDIIRASLGRTR